MLLALDTATRLISLALHDGHQVQYEATWHTANNHTVELAPAVQQALARTGLRPADLSAVAVSQGPGSFTGLRIGLSVAKGLASALNIALTAVPTLEIVAAGVPQDTGPLVVVLQAGRGRVCAQRFRWDGTAWTAAGPAEIAAWENLTRTVEPNTLFAGEIDGTGRSLIQQAGAARRIASGAHSLRRAGFLAEIAWSRLNRGEIDDPAHVTPIYLHQPGVPHP